MVWYLVIIIYANIAILPAPYPTQEMCETGRSQFAKTFVGAYCVPAQAPDGKH